MARFANLHLKTQPTVVPFKHDAVTPEGVPAYSDGSLKRSVARLALTGVLRNQYYKREDQVAQDIVDICGRMAQEDPVFLLKAAKVSRDFNMKLFPKVALAAALSVKTDDKTTQLVNEVAAKVLSTYNPNQLLEFVLMLKERQYGSGLGSRAQRVVGQALNSVGFKRMEDWTLANKQDLQRILRLVHPKMAPIVRYVLDEKEGTINGLAQSDRQKAMTQIKNPETKNVAQLIKDNRLPFNALKGVVGSDQDVWAAIADNMSVMELMLNLKSLDEKGVMDPRKLRKLLADKYVQGKTRLLPFDVMRPIANAPSNYNEVLIDLLEQLVSTPIEGLENKKVGIVLDGSGSMGGPGDASSPWMNSMSLVLPFLSSCQNRTFIIYSTELYFEGSTGTAYDYSTRSSKFSIPKFRAEAGAHNFSKLSKCFPSGGTDTGKALRHFLTNKIFLDVLVLVTDETQNGSSDAYRVWTEYRKKVNSRAKLLVVNATPYDWHIASNDDDSVNFIQTLTPAIYRMVQYQDADVVSVIEGINLQNVVE